MARIAGINLPNDKRIIIALTYIMGIGDQTSKKILSKLNISEDVRTSKLTDDEVEKIRKEVEKIKVEGDLRLEISRNIRRLKDISSYRGSRHAKGLPARGQRTKTNARTKRGKKVTVGSGRKKAAEKT